jgi:putative transposase
MIWSTRCISIDQLIYSNILWLSDPGSGNITTIKEADISEKCYLCAWVKLSPMSLAHTLGRSRTGMAEKAAHCYLCAELLPTTSKRKEEAVSRFRKLSHTIWHCRYHVVWVSKYRFRILKGPLKDACESGIQAICGFAGCELLELNVQADHVHLVVMNPPSVSVSISFIGAVERSDIDEAVTSISVFEKKPYGAQPFWGKGVLRGRSRAGCGHDTQVCPLPGETGTSDGALTTVGLKSWRHKLLGPPP